MSVRSAACLAPLSTSPPHFRPERFSFSRHLEQPSCSRSCTGSSCCLSVPSRSPPRWALQTFLRLESSLYCSGPSVSVTALEVTRTASPQLPPAPVLQTHLSCHCLITCVPCSAYVREHVEFGLVHCRVPRAASLRGSGRVLRSHELRQHKRGCQGNTFQAQGILDSGVG